MTMIDATTSLGTVVGSMLCTSLILTIGTTNVLLLAATISVISYAFSNIWIQESLRGALEVHNYIIVTIKNNIGTLSLKMICFYL